MTKLVPVKYPDPIQRQLQALIQQKSSKRVTITEEKPLGTEDVLDAINFAIDTIDFFAKTFTDNGQWIHPYEEGEW